MAVKQQQIAKVKPSRNNTTAAIRNKKSKRTAPPAKSKGAGRKRFNSKPPRPTPGDQPELKPGEAGNKLLGAINRWAILDCDGIAEAFIRKAKRGDMNGLRLLADLTGAKAQSSQPPPKPYRQLTPWTPEQLEAQAPWQPLSDPEVDTGFGGREPEN